MLRGACSCSSVRLSSRQHADFVASLDADGDFAVSSDELKAAGAAVAAEVRAMKDQELRAGLSEKLRATGESAS